MYSVKQMKATRLIKGTIFSKMDLRCILFSNIMINMNLKFFNVHSFKSILRCILHCRYDFIFEYLGEYSVKIENVSGESIWWKKPTLKISRHCPFKFSETHKTKSIQNFGINVSDFHFAPCGIDGWRIYGNLKSALFTFEKRHLNCYSL